MIIHARDGMATVCITLEMGFAKAVADKTVAMNCGRIVQGSTPAEFSDHAPPRVQQFPSQVF